MADTSGTTRPLVVMFALAVLFGAFAIFVFSQDPEPPSAAIRSAVSRIWRSVTASSSKG